MNEIKNHEINEIKMPEMDKYKEIKADSHRTDQERTAFLADKWKDVENAKGIEEIWKDYISDLKEKSDYGESISVESFDISKFERQSPEKVAERREEFDDNKNQLRRAWEALNGKEWPKYREDMINDKGQILRRAGDHYDAHHIQPLCLGGKNEALNMVPLDLNHHKVVHSIEGSCTTLVNKAGGVS